MFTKTIVLLLLTGLIAFGHAILVTSTPSINQTVAGPSLPVALTFNSKVDQARSTLMLERADHSTTRVPIEKDSSSPAKLTANVAQLAPGSYKLRWQVLAVDGHITRGEIPFKVR
jgi:hypothetical protein